MGHNVVYLIFHKGFTTGEGDIDGQRVGELGQKKSKSKFVSTKPLEIGLVQNTSLLIIQSLSRGYSHDRRGKRKQSSLERGATTDIVGSEVSPLIHVVLVLDQRGIPRL